MAVVGTISLQGGKELDRKLRELEPKVAKKVVRKALREGARPIQAQAKANIPAVGNRQHPAGTWRRSIKIRAAKRSRTGRIAVLVQSKEGDFKGEAFYGAFAEFGHKIGKRPGGGKTKRAADTRGEVPGKHYIQQAFDSKKDEAAAIVSREMAAGIERVAKEPA